ncbi:hypothetical protein EVAR_96305_1 [Eumeta japonica]|uniref:Uncharacterized protein n=1 Tax=Eumeta variegata TaxID=151549 RepID=A0A4C1VV08_EUMVA|nr:hypothetical protein EVAR_96305_1 [Eumeta japonica]
MYMELWSSIAAFGWLALVHGHGSGGDVEGVRYGPPTTTYTAAYINITYEDEHGEIYTETSDKTVRFYPASLNTRRSSDLYDALTSGKESILQSDVVVS